MYPDDAARGESARLFLALWPGHGERDALASASNAWAWPPGTSRTRPERLHITLHFIGNVPVARLDELRGGLAVPFEPCEFVLTEPQVWRGGIAVLCAVDIPPALAELHERLARALHGLKLPVEDRPWRPHVTFARKAFGAKPPREPHAVPWRATGGYALVRSLPGGRGYDSLAGFA